MRATLLAQAGIDEVEIDFASKTAYVAPADKLDLDAANAALAKRGSFSVTRR